MNKLEKNVQQVVASRVLKTIHRIVSEEEIKEKQERYWAMLIAGFVVFIGIVIVVLKVI